MFTQPTAIASQGRIARPSAD